jgi:homoserine dehydrogenase
MGGELEKRESVKLNIKKILVRDIYKKRSISVPKDLLTTNPLDILDDPEITLVVEALGGDMPAAEYIKHALMAGKSVVTANKLALATHWRDLLTTASKYGSKLYFEAGVCGAIPIIRTVTDSLQANRIDRLYGIINGTTNYILSEMSQKGVSYADALFEAQKLGIAEPDPTADVEGGDAACKLAILSTLAFHSLVPLDEIYSRGITTITPLDIQYGKDLGYALKLLATSKREGDIVCSRVHPTFVPQSHPLASVSGSYNAVYLFGHACGEMMLFGRGAGDYPTASAVVSDMITAARGESAPQYRMTSESTITPNWESRYFIRLKALDKPGVLGTIAGILGKHKVSIASMRQNPTGETHAPLLFVTHLAHELDVRAALAEIGEDIATIENVIYVEDV